MSMHMGNNPVLMIVEAAKDDIEHLGFWALEQKYFALSSSFSAMKHSIEDHGNKFLTEDSKDQKSPINFSSLT